MSGGIKMIKLALGCLLRCPIFILAYKYIPQDEPGLTSAIVLYVIGDLLVQYYYSTRSVVILAIPPSSPGDKNGDSNDKV